MKRKRYLAFGLVLVGVAAIVLAGWAYAGPASARPNNTCNPQDYPGGIDQHPGGHCVPATTTTAKPATTTTKASTTTTKAGPTTTAGGPATTAGGPTTTKAGVSTSTTAGGPTTTSAGPTTTAGSTTTVTLVPGGIGFSDVPSTHPYYTQISDMVSRQVIGATVDGTFKPDLPVTRQYFARMIVKVLGLVVTGKEFSPFTDLVSGKDSDPFYPDKYVAVCFAQGITVGKTSTRFAPTDDLTRQQLITMVVRAAKLSDPSADFTPPFTIGQFYPDEHYANARKAASLGLLDGLQGVGSAYDFLAPATRGEVCFMLYKLLNK
jgi:hypothetical protein